MTTEQRQELLETIDVVERLKLVSDVPRPPDRDPRAQGRIQSEVKSEMDKTQREYILREQLKAIQRELGEDDPQQAEINELREKVEAAGMPDEVKARAIKEVDRMSRIPSASPEVGVIRTYVDWLVGLPWNVSTDDHLDIKEAAKILDEDHYGLEKVKERILEYLAVRALADTIRSPILALVGPPGVGKTSLGKSIARAMGRKFVRMSLGGIHDEAEIRGHRRTYIGALPGRIIQNVKTAGTNNPVFMLDEIDKIGMDFRGDPSSALLEVLDPEQNNSFQDNYLEVPFDLQQGALHRDGQPPRPDPAGRSATGWRSSSCRATPSRRRSRSAKRFLVPKQMENHGLKPRTIEITDEAMAELVQAYTKEAGVRNLEREIANIMRKVARTVAEGRKRKTVIDVKKLELDFLGPPRFEYGELEPRTRSARQRAWWSPRSVATSSPSRSPGWTARRTSSSPASSARSCASPLGPACPGSGPRGRARHRRARPSRSTPSTSTCRPGPSPRTARRPGSRWPPRWSGVHRASRSGSDLVMTGEITLRGRVLPIGGLKSKILAAHLVRRPDGDPAAQEREGPPGYPRGDPQADQARARDSMDQVLETALRRRPKPLPATPKTPTSEPGRKDEPEAETPIRRPNFPPDQPTVVV